MKKKYGNQVTLFLKDDIMKVLEKRAKKNLFTISEQIEDILRRSTMNQLNKKSTNNDKVDDKLITIFSRKGSGSKKKKK